MFPFKYLAIPDSFTLTPTAFAKVASKRKEHAKLTKSKPDKMSKKQGRIVYETSSPSSSMHHLISETDSIRALADTADTADTESVCVLAAVQGKLKTFAIMDDANAHDPVSGKVMNRWGSSCSPCVTALV